MPAQIAEKILAKNFNTNARATDRLFAGVLALEWVAGIFTSLVVSPIAWSGTTSSLHIHVILAVFLGAAIVSLPIYMALTRPGETLTRHVVAAAQMMFGALLIHLSGGRIESHFHVFGSLAFLLVYWDWRVLVTASIVVALDHLVRGLFYPLSVYGVSVVDPYRWIEHSGWVVFEDCFLFVAIRNHMQHMRQVAIQQAELLRVKESIEEKVKEQTHELSHLAGIVKSCHEAIYTRTVDGCITSWNAGAEGLFGYTEAEILGKKSSILWPDGDRTKYVNEATMFESGEVRDWETTRKRKDGTLVEIAVTISPIYGEDGKSHGVSAICRDITERIEAERRITEFYSTVSHELRSPLTSIRGALSMVTHGMVSASSPEGAELLAIAHTSSTRLIRLVNDILDLRKIEAGKLELDFASCNVNDIVAGATAAMQGMANERSITLNSSGKSDRQLLLDVDRIEQVLTNLISNAIKFAPAGSEVTVKVEDVEGGVRASVTDQGTGIKPEQQHLLFGKFQQLDSSDSRAQEGSGLGLAISKAITEQHGGKIGLESQVGHGSTFWIELPINDLEKRRKPTSKRERRVSKPHPVLEAPPEPAANKSANVLLVDDDIDGRQVLAAQLKGLGVNCLHANDGAEALDSIRNSVPDLIVLDVGMPNVDGFQVVSAMKVEGQANIPILVFTGRDLSQAERALLTLGLTEFLTKGTATHQDLLRVISELLEQCGSNDGCRKTA